MGEVYEVYDPRLKRTLALKIQSLERSCLEIDRKRFLAEARSTAKLDHPNIVKVHDIGCVGERPYFTMDLLPARTLRSSIEEGVLSFRQIAEICASAALAVDHAHARGIVHRDLKPENIMMAGEISVVTDFGLAASNPAEACGSDPCAILGTLPYMSPEQASGNQESVDARSDVYSLGAILYEMSSGRTPFPECGCSRTEYLCRILEERPVPPSRIRPDIPEALEKICLKALEKRKENRYRSAADFAADLRNFLQGRALSACEPPGSRNSVSSETGRCKNRRRASGRARAWNASLLLFFCGLCYLLNRATPPEMPRISGSVEEAAGNAGEDFEDAGDSDCTAPGAARPSPSEEEQGPFLDIENSEIVLDIENSEIVLPE